MRSYRIPCAIFASLVAAACGGGEPNDTLYSSQSAYSAPEALNPNGQTLVFVRHAQSMANYCEELCGSDGTCCSAAACAPGCEDNTCNCDANLRTFGPKGVGADGKITGLLKDLHLRWDKILVSPTERTQLTIKKYLEAEHLTGTIVPEIDETWNDSQGSCDAPPWKRKSYPILAQGLSPREYIAEWDPFENAQSGYDHSKGNAECEQIIQRRAFEYIDGLFSEKAMKTVLVVTHAATGEALLARLTGKDDQYLKNAPAYTVLKRSSIREDWTMVAQNASTESAPSSTPSTESAPSSTPSTEEADEDAGADADAAPSSRSGDGETESLGDHVLTWYSFQDNTPPNSAMTSSGRPLIPFVSVALPSRFLKDHGGSLEYGDKLYVKFLDGKTMPNGTRHTGWVQIDDYCGDNGDDSYCFQEVDGASYPNVDLWVGDFTQAAFNAETCEGPAGAGQELTAVSTGAPSEGQWVSDYGGRSVGRGACGNLEDAKADQGGCWDYTPPEDSSSHCEGCTDETCAR